MGEESGHEVFSLKKCAPPSALLGAQDGGEEPCGLTPPRGLKEAGALLAFGVDLGHF